MVVTGIFMILSTVVLSTNSHFGSLIVLQNLGHDIALSVREAQVYGIAVRRYSSDIFDKPYGVHFSVADPDSQSIYQLFADLNGDDVYVAGQDAIVTETTMKGGYRIAEICTTAIGTSVEVCSRDIEDNAINIVFKRPEPDAIMRRGAGELQNGRVRITIESNDEDQSNITIEASGQISVE